MPLKKHSKRAYLINKNALYQFLALCGNSKPSKPLEQSWSGGEGKNGRFVCYGLQLTMYCFFLKDNYVDN